MIQMGVKLDGGIGCILTNSNLTEDVIGDHRENSRLKGFFDKFHVDDYEKFPGIMERVRARVAARVLPI